MKRTVNPAVFWIPEGLDLDSMLGPRLADYAGFLLSKMRWLYLTWRADFHGWVRLKHEYLTAFIPWYVWPRLRDLLIQSEVLECDFLAQQGTKAYSYRLKPEYQVRHVATHCKSARLSRKLRDDPGEERLLPVHHWLRYSLSKIHFDASDAQAIIAKLSPRRADSPLTDQEYRILLSEVIERLVRDRRWLTVDAYGRVHTAITSLPKELRGCISIGGEQLVEIDIVSSQPLFLGLIAQCTEVGSRASRWRWFNREFTGRNLYKHIPNTNTPPTHNTPPYNDSTPVTTHLDLRTSDDGTPSAFLKSCENGRIYEELMRGDDNRDTFKRQFFAMLYGDLWWDSELRRRFKERFPSVDAMLSAMKRKRGRAYVPRLLQAVESSFVIGRVCRRIHAEAAAVPLLTIHDSVLTTERYTQFLNDLIMDEFDRFGVRPNLRKKTNGIPN